MLIPAGTVRKLVRPTFSVPPDASGLAREASDVPDFPVFRLKQGKYAVRVERVGVILGLTSGSVRQLDWLTGLAARHKLLDLLGGHVFLSIALGEWGEWGEWVSGIGVVTPT